MDRVKEGHLEWIWAVKDIDWGLDRGDNGEGDYYLSGMGEKLYCNFWKIAYSFSVIVGLGFVF